MIATSPLGYPISKQRLGALSPTLTAVASIAHLRGSFELRLYAISAGFLHWNVQTAYLPAVPHCSTHRSIITEEEGLRAVE